MLICDFKNHLIRSANLHSRQVKHIVGVPGLRGQDKLGGKLPGNLQQIASPWDIVQAPRGIFLIAMAGLHQIWSLDLGRDRCGLYSGSSREGNLNSTHTRTTWAQPSGLTIGQLNNEPVLFVADSESSSVRAVGLESRRTLPVVGATADENDLFAFGDTDGQGYSARL